MSKPQQSPGIPFNKPYLTGKEMHYMYQAVYSGKISGNGLFTKKCQAYFEASLQVPKTLLTTSCTDALEMSAILGNIGPGDEVILPSYTFVSTALAFIRQGARLVFADSRPDHPGIDEESLGALITPRTRAIVPVHYAGVACDMDKILHLAEPRDILVIEDAAQAVDSFYKGRPLGSLGDMAAFSFHETKNINSGEGGLLAIRNTAFTGRAEIIWEKGTDRARFFRGEVDKYGWVDTGSSFLPSDIIAAYLWAQIENLTLIQNRRKAICQRYQQALEGWALQQGIGLPVIPDYATQNGHMFYLVFTDAEQRQRVIDALKADHIMAVFHYLSLHSSKYYAGLHDGRELPRADRYSECLLRLPIYFELSDADVDRIAERVIHAL